jgi:tetratricopeptide (TPR) repeat protein
MARGAYGPARVFLRQADDMRPRNPDNLHDLAVCSVMLARDKFDQGNYAAAMRELDEAVAFYSTAIDVYPGHQASIEGKSVALKLKGQFEEAMKHAEWAAEFVGPSARQYILLARDLEATGDKEGALLRYRQAVAVEPRNPEAHTEIAKFLLENHNEPAAVQHLQMAYRLNPRAAWVVDELTSRGALPPLAPASQPEP